MVAAEDRDRVGICLYVPRRVRSRFTRLVQARGLSVRFVLQCFMTQFDAEQAEAFVKARTAAEAVAARALKAREGGTAAA